VAVDGTVVVGLGGIGSAAAYHLASRGETVLGLDPRAPGHRAGSSHGRTRLVRQAYFEDPRYVPLAARAWRLWHELAATSGERLLTPTGVVTLARCGDADRLVPSVLAAADQHGLAVERLDAGEIRNRFPAVHVEDDWEGAFERDAGFVDPEATVRVHQRLAAAAGADLRAEAVVGLEVGSEPVVTTAEARYHPRAVVVTAGPWAPELLAAAGLPIAARRKVVAHFTPLDLPSVSAPALPGFVLTRAGGTFYGFPSLPGQGVKIGRHDGGDTTTPDSVDRRVRPEEIEELRAVLADVLPAAAGALLDAYTCLYTMSSDGHFLVGALPDAPGCFIATGCSGHAFKFVPVLGEVLADLATGRAPQVDIRFLDPGRFRTAAPPSHGSVDAGAPESCGAAPDRRPATTSG
jgi:sarcosine oxidase